MPLQQTRRALLASGSTLAATALAGCSAVPGFGPASESSEPDAGTDSYGIVVRNSTETSYEVTVKASPRGEDPFFEKTVESTPEEDVEWDSVLTGDGMFLVEASVDDDHYLEEVSQPIRNVVVGSENSPEVDDVLVLLQERSVGVALEVLMDYGPGG